MARPEDATEMVPLIPAMAAASREAGEPNAAAEWDALAREDDIETEQTPVVDSPSISGDWPVEDAESDWPSLAAHEDDDAEFNIPHRGSWFGKLVRASALPRAPRIPFLNLTVACAAMSALVLALMIWRTDVVRLLPQTAGFYKLVGLEVNLRELLFKDVKITSESVEGKALLIIEGVVVGEAFHRAAALPIIAHQRLVRAVIQMRLQKLRRVFGRAQIFSVVENLRGARKGGDHQAIPRRNDLVVQVRTWTFRAHFAQLLACWSQEFAHFIFTFVEMRGRFA